MKNTNKTSDWKTLKLQIINEWSYKERNYLSKYIFRVKCKKLSFKNVLHLHNIYLQENLRLNSC